VVFVTNESLRSAVRKAAAEFQPPLAFSFEGDGVAGRTSYTVQLDFSSTVDDSGQKRNQGGASAGGPASVILGAVTPWPCTVTHRLNASVSDPNGKQVGSYQLEQKETVVGTMLACPDFKGPGKSQAMQLVTDLLQKTKADKLFPETPPN
jgi:hypothetical protein